MHFSLKCNFTTLKLTIIPYFVLMYWECCYHIEENLFNCNCMVKFVSLSIYVDSYYILQAPYIMICKSETKTMFIAVVVITHFIYLVSGSLTCLKCILPLLLTWVFPLDIYFDRASSVAKQFRATILKLVPVSFSCLACWRLMLLLATTALARELLLKLHMTASLLGTM